MSIRAVWSTSFLFVFCKIHCSKYSTELCVFCHWLQYKCNHNPTQIKSLIYKENTCLSFDKFSSWWKMMILDKNEVIPFQKFPWKALCKKWIFVKDTPFFKTKFKDEFLNQTQQHHQLWTFHSHFMFQKSLGYAIKNSKDSTEFQKKSSFSIKLKTAKFEPWTCAAIVLSYFYEPMLWLSLQNSNRNFVSTLLSSEMQGLSVGHGLTLSPGKFH